MNPTRNRVGDWFLFGALFVLLVLCLPLIAVFAFVSRFVLVGVAAAALTVGVVLYAFNPRFRDWLREVTAPQILYKGLRLATDVAVSPSHSWARIEPDGVVVGADDLVQAVLGPVEAVDLPPAGRRVRRGERLAGLRSGERSVDLLAPVTGTVTGTNPALRDRPRWVNEEPFARGWAVRLRADDPRTERRRLLRGSRARAWFRREVDRLVGWVLAGDAGEPTLADGGPLVAELHHHIDDAAWQRVKAAFLAAPPEGEKPPCCEPER